jgi:cytochrome b involved in lipid metabolism
MGEKDIIPAAEIKRHNSKGDLWLTIHGNVYDVSEFMTEHPYVYLFIDLA